MDARRLEERSVLSILKVVLGKNLNVVIKRYVERSFSASFSDKFIVLGQLFILWFGDVICSYLHN